MGALFGSLLILALLGLLGLLVAIAIRPRLRWPWLLPVAYPLGSGILTWSLFLLSWLGVTLNLRTSALAYVVILVVVLAYLFRSRRWNSVARADQLSSLSLTNRMALGATILMLLVLWVWTSWLAVGRSYWAWDSAAIWSVKGYGIALEQTIFVNWGEHGLSYPFNVPLQISIFQMAGMEALPGSKLLFPIFYIFVLGGILAFWLRNRVVIWLAGLGVLLIATVPEVFQHAHLGYEDLPKATYLVPAGLLAVEGVHRNDRSASVLAGVLLGLGAWTRLEGTLHGVAVLSAIALACIYLKCDRSNLAAMELAFGVIIAPWVVFYLVIGSSGSGSSGVWQAMLTDIRSGQVDWYHLRLVFGFFRRQALDRTVWGILFPVILALGILNWRRLGLRANTGAFTGLLLGLFTAAVVFLLMFANSFVRDDLVGLMNQLFSRTFLPAALLTAAAVVLATSSDRHRDQQ